MCHLRYLKIILAHKWKVFRLCLKFGIPWRGLIHDWTKFRPSEWFAHARFFGGKTEDQIDVKDLDRAWHLHQRRNRHHWHWWVAWSDDGTYQPRAIPDSYFFEMVADWIARAESLEALQKWWVSRSGKLPIEKHTKERLGSIIMLYLDDRHFL